MNSRTPNTVKMNNILLCPHCLKENLQLEETSTLRCGRCKVTFCQNPSTFFYDFRSQVSSQDKGLLIEQELDFYSNNIFENHVRTSTRKRYKKTIQLLKPENILDIGCGTGALAETIREDFASYIGFEPSDVPNRNGCSSPENVFLFHDDVGKELPIRNQSIDLVLFMASYDHIPNPKLIVRDAWNKLKYGGHLMIVMSNYAFWIKSFINLMGSRTFFKHEHEHYCVHSPESLEKEILSFVPEAHLEMIDADDLYIPNLPKVVSLLYFNNWWLWALNKVLKFFCTSILRLKHRGSTMILVFKK